MLTLHVIINAQWGFDLLLYPSPLPQGVRVGGGGGGCATRNNVEMNIQQVPIKRFNEEALQMVQSSLFSKNASIIKETI